MNFWASGFWADGFWADLFWVGEEGGGGGGSGRPAFVLATPQYPTVTVDLPQQAPPV